MAPKKKRKKRKNKGKNRAGAKKDAKKRPKKKTKEKEKKCPKKVKIIAVEFLNGDDKIELSGTGKHFVNLPRNNKWVDGTHVLNIDRLSQTQRVKVRFNKKGSHKFKVKFKPGGANIVYTNAEKNRNGKFKFQDGEKSYTTDADGTKVIPTDFFVTAAGKDTYRFIAEDDNGKKVTSKGSIKTHRLVYYQEIKMKTVAAAANLNACKAEFANHGITLVGLASTEMNRIANVQLSEKNNYLNKARLAYNGTTASTKAPYVVAIGFTDHLADKETLIVAKSNVKVGPGESDVQIPLVNASGQTKSLWNNIVPGEDWFMSAMFVGLDMSGPLHIPTFVPISKANCTALPVGADNCKKVKVKVSGLHKGKGTVSLQVKVVKGMWGGLSFGGGNFVCVCTRSWWKNKSIAAQNQVMVHELGHKFGMVTDGTGKKPDKPAKYYTGKGHMGPHCHKGLPVKASYSSDAGACVMFGATNAPKAFCNHCTPAIRKMDLSTGWSAF